MNIYSTLKIPEPAGTLHSSTVTPYIHPSGQQHFWLLNGINNKERISGEYLLPLFYSFYIKI